MANLSNINNKFLVTTGGDVGVGVTSPGSKLSIGGTTGSYDSGIGFQPTGTGARIYRTFIATDGSFRFDDVTAGFLTRLTIQAGGNVGIGTTLPAAGLQVAKGGLSIPPAGGAQSSAVFGNVTSDDNYGLAVGANSNGIGYISSQRTDGTATTYNLAIQPNGGNVGIGTDLPNNKLDVNGDVFINSNYTANVAAQDLTIGKTTTGNHGLTIVTGPTYTGSIYFGDSGNNDAGIIKYQHSNNSMQFVTNRSEAMRINSSGNVGIGTTNIGTQSNLYLGASSSSEGGQITLQKATGGTLAAHIDAYTSGGTDFMRVLSGTDTATTAAPFVFNLTSVRLGIGTTSPSSDISGSVTMLEINDATNNNLASLALKAGTQGSKWEIAAQSSNALGFFDDGTERMRIDSNGNVGIGTTSPQRLLHLRSTNEATGIFLERSANYGFVQYNQVVGSVETYHLGFVNNNTFSSDILVANESGNVGIGTASPQAKLSVVGSGENGGIFFNNSGAQEHRFYSSANSQFNTIGSSTPIWNWAQYTGVGVTPNYKMTLNNTGLGIGTTSPSAKLEVSGNIKLSTAADIIVFGSGGTSPAWSAPQIARIASYMTMSDYSGVQFGGYDGTSYGPRMIVLGTGNVGIGTTNPSNKLDVAGNVSLANYSGTGENQTILAQNSYGQMRAGIRSGTPYIGSISPLDFALYTGNSEKMRITNAGNVGIGTTSPDGTLHVVGKVNTNRIVSSNLIAGNIRSNLTTTTYLLLVDLNVSAGFSLVGELNAASYTTYNVSRIYIRKNYNATTGAAVITGIAKSGSNLSVVDISHSSGRFIAIKLTGDPEIDVMWTGYRLNDQFNSDGTIKILTSGVTENSVYASY